LQKKDEETWNKRSCKVVSQLCHLKKASISEKWPSKIRMEKVSWSLSGSFLRDDIAMTSKYTSVREILMEFTRVNLLMV
jgi:hypothetical protein